MEHWRHGIEEELPPEDLLAALDRLWERLDGVSRVTIREHIHLGFDLSDKAGTKRATRNEEFKGLSSNGLSQLGTIIIYAAFLHHLKGGTDIHMLWTLDELRDLDQQNCTEVIKFLRENHITVAAAWPDPDHVALSNFEHTYCVIRNTGLQRYQRGVNPLTRAKNL